MLGILVVDDDRDLLEMVRAYLTRAGFEVEVACGGEEALALYRPERHDIVLSDVQMPGMDGFGLQARLVARDPAATVVFMTGRPWDEGLLRSITAGTGGYVEKPFDFPYLVALLQRAARKALARRSTAQPVEEGSPVGTCAAAVT